MFLYLLQKKSAPLAHSWYLLFYGDNFPITTALITKGQIYTPYFIYYSTPFSKHGTGRILNQVTNIYQDIEA